MDPWASPEMHVGHTHPVNNEETPKSNGITAARPIPNGHKAPERTTSTFTTQPESQPSTSLSAPPDQEPRNGGNGEGWDGSGGFRGADQSGLGPEGFGPSGDGQRGLSGSDMGRSIGGGHTTNRGVEEIVTISVLPEKEGIFMFQHRNYEVKSARRSSTVVRRYSDFVWLLDCLHKRYPFRQLPLLPPKRVAGRFGPHCDCESKLIRTVTPSKRETSFFRCDIHRKAETRARKIHQYSGSTSRPWSRATCCYVFDCTDSK